MIRTRFWLQKVINQKWSVIVLSIPGYNTVDTHTNTKHKNTCMCKHALVANGGDNGEGRAL